MAWVELRKVAAVGILGFGVHGAQIAPPLSKDNSLGGEKQYVAQGTTYRAIDFSNWPRVEEDCYAYYPNPEAREYQIFIRCPGYSMENLIPGEFVDFSLDIDIKNVNGSNAWYGPMVATNRGTIRERVHRFLVSDEGLFRYQQIDNDPNSRNVQQTNILPLPEASQAEAENAKRFRLIRRGRTIEVISNGVSLYEDEIFLDSQRVNIGFAIIAPRALRGEAQIFLQAINVRFPTERYLPPDLAMLFRFDL